MTDTTATTAAPVDEAELRRRLEALSLEQKVRLLMGADFWSLHPEPSIGLRRLVVSDGPAGVRGELWASGTRPSCCRRPPRWPPPGTPS